MCNQHIRDVVTLNNGVEMPKHGLGLYLMTDPAEIEEAVNQALAVGYRSFDTAQLYGNEAYLGRLLRESTVPRDEYFITTKILNENQGYDLTLSSFEQSMNDLGVSQVDALLVHWPSEKHFFETWRALERLYDEKAVRAIGVSNYQTSHLQKLFTKANVKPVLNQIELHPYLTQEPLKTFLDKEDIFTEAWSPLGRGSVLDDPSISEIAAGYKKSPAQVILRWHLQRATMIIPKSATPNRILENSQIYDFSLSAEEMAEISSLNRNQRNGPEPDEVYRQI